MPTSKASESVPAHRRIVPPLPKPGERGARPYSTDDLNALWATTHALAPKALVTLNPPPARRILTWDALRAMLTRLKDTLGNFRRRHGFPPLVIVTEFDRVPLAEGDIYCANFHVGLATPLSAAQQERLRDWWLEVNGLDDNQGRAFQHDAREGGTQLADYLAKDVSRRGGGGLLRYVKFHAPWLPPRTECRLWFVLGSKHHPAQKGAAMRRARGLVRRHFDGTQGNGTACHLTASTGGADGAQGTPLITADGKPAMSPAALSVTLSPLPAAVASAPLATTLDCTRIAQQDGIFCGVCARRWGRQLWSSCCVCTGHVKLGVFWATGTVSCLPLTRPLRVGPRHRLSVSASECPFQRMSHK